MNKILRYIRHNWYELLVTFCLFSNLYPYTFPSFLYYVGLMLIFFKMLTCKVKFQKQYALYAIFICSIWLSVVVNLAMDLRPALFTFILVIASPLFTNVRWHLYKKKLLHNIFMGFACTVIASLIARALGINYQATLRMGESLELYGRIDEFSGFAKFPMWNSAAAAVSMIYFAYLLFRKQKPRAWLRWFYIAMFFASMYVCLISASRSAFAFAILASGLLLVWLAPKLTNTVKYIAIFAVIGALSYSFFMTSATRMIEKQTEQEERGTTSRDELWAQRIEEFKSSPIVGVGFAVHGIDEESRGIGRDESGSSWLAVLAQAGLVGFVIALAIWCTVFTRTKYIKYDQENILVYALFAFFTLHTIFEGYMFQGGWYMCVICWMTLGVLSESRMYRRQVINMAMLRLQQQRMKGR